MTQSHDCPYTEQMQKLERMLREFETMKTTQKILLGMLGVLVVMVGWTLHSINQTQTYVQKQEVSRAYLRSDMDWMKETMKRIEKEVVEK